MARMVQFDFIEDDRRYSYRIGIMIPKKRERETILELPKNKQLHTVNPFELFATELNQLEKELLDLFSKNYDIEERIIKDFVKSKNFYVASFHKTEDFYASNFNYDTHRIKETPPDILNFKNCDETSCNLIIDTINNLTKKSADVYYLKIFFRNRTLHTTTYTDDFLCDDGQLFLIKKYSDKSRRYYSYQNSYYYKIVNQGFSVPCSDENYNKEGIYHFNIMSIDPHYSSYRNEINIETSHSESGYFSNIIPFTIPFSTYGNFRPEEFEILKEIETINNRKDVKKIIKFSQQKRNIITSKSTVRKEEFLEKGWPNFGNYEDLQICPFCSSEHVHIESVSIYRQNEQSVVRIKNNETLIGVPNEIHDELYKKCSTYGATIMTTYWCEDDNDYWVHIENFHKGDLLTINVLLGKKEFSPGYGADELWRY